MVNGFHFYIKIRQNRMGWDGMAQEGIGWHEMAWDGIGQDRIEITKQITDSKGNIMTLI